MSAGGKRTALPGLEVHRILADPRDVAAAVVLEHAFLALAQERQS